MRPKSNPYYAWLTTLWNLPRDALPAGGTRKLACQAKQFASRFRRFYAHLDGELRDFPPSDSEGQTSHCSRTSQLRLVPYQVLKQMNNAAFALAVKCHHTICLTALRPKDAMMLQELWFASVNRVIEQVERGLLVLHQRSTSDLDHAEVALRTRSRSSRAKNPSIPAKSAQPGFRQYRKTDSTYSRPFHWVWKAGGYKPPLSFLPITLASNKCLGDHWSCIS
jgi:hypothetical protein